MAENRYNKNPQGPLNKESSLEDQQGLEIAKVEKAIHFLLANNPLKIPLSFQKIFFPTEYKTQYKKTKLLSLLIRIQKIKIIYRNKPQGYPEYIF